MRTLGVDFGERRVGVAVSDAAGRLALPLTTLERRSDRQLIGALEEIIRREGIGAVVVGDPVRLDGARGEASRRATGFARKLEAACGLPVRLVPETLTSHEARDRLRATGSDPRRHPERVDAVAAQLLLQDALDRELRETPARP